jgi:hypothetical protein
MKIHSSMYKHTKKQYETFFLKSSCPRSLKIDVSFTFTTSNNITILTNLVQILYQIVSSMGIELRSVDRCNTNETGI